ncbi:alpha/beta hydrolase [Pseudomonas sp. 5P_3.1_Bac2]|uniref:alpha/beta hydrolase n=1 Tax=Pseudomonas sp. 5P_3.1_Bac2 TaxID=2971617 RepID=UPI0021C9520E|nr:alpha/beta hydrolase [Pseudomonas sp. 5P_3.1_Bac2]MCU1718473.1 alpha/beta hydrolase [Pseudomonas sp. 5P_3.1_Bac2]
MSVTNQTLINFAHEARSNYRNLIPLAGQPDALFAVKNMTLTGQNPDRQLPARLYTPSQQPEQTSYPLVLFLHGGGWISGDLDTHDVLARALALGLNAQVLAVQYRLAPESDGFAQVDDALLGLTWLFEQADSLQGNTRQIVVVGDSAGATLAANLASRLVEDNSAIKLAAQWLMYPAVNFDFATPSMRTYGENKFPDKSFIALARQAYLPADVAENDPRLVPYFSNHAHAVPSIVSLAGEDPLSSAAQEYAQKLIDNNIQCECTVYPGQAHGFIQFYKDKAANPLGEKALRDGLGLLKAWLKGL